MAIGLGILLCIAGLVLALDVVTFDLSYVNDNALGWILLIAGVVTLVLSMASLSMARRREVRVEEHDRV